MSLSMDGMFFEQSNNSMAKFFGQPHSIMR